MSNFVRIKGGLTKTPNVGYTEGTGAPFWYATVAVNGTRWDPEQKRQVVTTAYIAVAAFGEPARVAVQAGLDKGDEVRIEGALAQREITHKDGTKERKTSVEADVITPTRIRDKLPPPPVADDPPPAPWS